MKLNLIMQCIELLEDIIKNKEFNNAADVELIRKLSSCVFLLKSSLEKR